jgi:cellulose biosynthesis protein BcsQ
VADPYILAVASHKGGTGRTTAALTLAWALGESGRRVTFIDADEQRSASLMAVDQRGQCSWRGVQFRAGPESLQKPLDGDIVVIDPPALTSQTAQPVLRRANGIVLTCLADPLSIRTVPAAATVIETAKVANARLELLGILICIYNAQDVLQNAMLERLKQAHRELLLDPAIPFQPDVRNWPLHPGNPPPAGPARDAAVTLAGNLIGILSR